MKKESMQDRTFRFMEVIADRERCDITLASDWANTGQVIFHKRMGPTRGRSLAMSPQGALKYSFQPTYVDLTYIPVNNRGNGRSLGSRRYTDEDFGLWVTSAVEKACSGSEV